MHKRHKETLNRKELVTEIKQVERCATLLAIKEMQVKLQWNITLCLSEKLIWEIVTAPNAKENVGNWITHTFLMGV